MYGVAPGPHGFLLLGMRPQRWRNPLAFLIDIAQRYGDVVNLDSGRLYLVNHPTHIKHVLLDNHRNYRKDHNSRFERLLGTGLLTSDGAFWRRQRRALQPAFHREQIAVATTIMANATMTMVNRWEAYATHGQPFDVVPELMRLTLQIVGQALFSTDMSGAADTMRWAFTTVLEHITRLSLLSFPTWLPTPGNRQFQQALDVLDQVVFRLMTERRHRHAPVDDLLTLLMEAHDAETGAPISERQVRDEVMTILFAGQETTATALAWMWYLLATHPIVEQRLRAELAAVLGGRTPTREDLPKLVYTRMVIDEALRLYPPAWAFARVTQADDELGGYRIPAGATVTVSPYLMHRHPAFWEHPERFDPDRFAPDLAAGRPRFAYIPFGGGPHQCIGNAFALTEMQIVAATVAQNYRLHLLTRHRIEPYPLVTLRPRHGIIVMVEKLPQYA